MSDSRDECYAKIRACMTTRYLDYYKEHKNLLGDDRSQQSIRESMAGIDCIIAVLDHYDITHPKVPRG